MNGHEVGKQYVALCKVGKNIEALNTLFSEGVVSVEAMAMPGHEDRATKGIANVRANVEKWIASNEVHSAECHGPYPHDDRFAVRFVYDITNKASGQRMKMDEIGLFTVENGKITREEFFYSMGG